MSPRSARNKKPEHEPTKAVAPAGEPFWSKELLLVCALAVVTAIVFSPALQNGFITWDDDHNFLENPSYRGLGLTQLRWMWTTTLLGHYVPLSWMTLGLDYTFWGMNPAGYHLTNVWLHVLGVVLLYFLARRVLSRIDNVGSDDAMIGAAFAAMLYAVHPLRVESVVWITERRDVLSQVFLIASALQYVRALDDESKYRPRYLQSIACFVLSLLSKASGAAFPVALLILDVYPLRRLGGDRGWWSAGARQVYLEKVPYFLLSAATGIVSVLSLPARAQLPLSAKAAVTAYSLAFYVWKSVLPVGLSPLYPMPVHIDPLTARFIISALVVLGVTMFAVLTRRRWPGALAGWLAFVAMTLPLAGIVQNGPQLVADRYTFIGSPALAILAGGFIVRREHRRLTVGLFGAVVAMFAALTWQQIHVWRSSESFWSFVAARAPESAIAHGGLGDAVGARGDVDSAITEYRRAIALDPTLATAENNLGVTLFRRRDTAEAVLHLRRAVAIDDRYADAHMNLGAVLAAQDNVQDAAREFSRALALSPGLAAAHYYWGNALSRRGDIAAALVHYSAAAAMAPNQQEFQMAQLLAEERLRKEREAAPLVHPDTNSH